MMTREEILSIEEYCAEYKISHRKHLEELGIPFWNIYKAKRKYREEDETDTQSGQLFNFHPEDMFLRQCLRHVLQASRVNQSNLLKGKKRVTLQSNSRPAPVRRCASRA